MVNPEKLTPSLASDISKKSPVNNVYGAEDAIKEQSRLHKQAEAMERNNESKIDIPQIEQEIASSSSGFETLQKENKKLDFANWESVFQYQSVLKPKLSDKEIESWSQSYLSKKESGHLWMLTDNAIGEIEELTVTNPELKPGAEVIAITKVFHDRKIIIVCPEVLRKDENLFKEKFKSQLKKEGVKSTENIEFRFSDDRLDRWSRDNFLSVYDFKEGKKVFLRSASAKAEFKGKFTEDIVSQDSTRRSKQEIAPFYFEGGDIRAIGPYLFVGEETFEKAAKDEQLRNKELPELIPTAVADNGPDINPELSARKKSKPSAEELLAQKKLKKELEQSFGRKVIVVGEMDEYAQAVFHLDMFVTFLPNADGKPTVVIGDMEQSKNILKNTPAETLDQTSRNVLSSQILVGMETTLSRPFSDIIKELENNFHLKVLQKRMDAAAEWFIKNGFDVVRMPTLFTYNDQMHRAYNNALVETYMNEKGTLERKIYLPTFGVSPVEAEIVKKYNELGYEVTPVPGLAKAATLRGSLNCLTSERRKPFKRN